MTLLLGALVAIAPLAMDVYLPSMPAMTRALATSPEAVQLTVTLYMFAWGVADADHALAVIDAVPGIDGRMLAHVQAQIEGLGSWALFVGPTIGTPYKVYAATAGAAGVSIAAFVLASLASRATRFVLLVLAAAWCAEHPLRGWTLRQRRQAVLLFWGLVYVVYFGWHRTL